MRIALLLPALSLAAPPETLLTTGIEVEPASLLTLGLTRRLPFETELGLNWAVPTALLDGMHHRLSASVRAGCDPWSGPETL